MEALDRMSEKELQKVVDRVINPVAEEQKDDGENGIEVKDGPVEADTEKVDEADTANEDEK